MSHRDHSSDKIEYPVLSTYINLCRERNIDCSHVFPSSSIIDELLRFIESGAKSMNDVVGFIERTLGNKLVCDLSVEAFRRVYNVNIDCDSAKRHLYVELAHWYIDILALLGYIRVKEAWKP